MIGRIEHSSKVIIKLINLYIIIKWVAVLVRIKKKTNRINNLEKLKSLLRLRNLCLVFREFLWKIITCFIKFQQKKESLFSKTQVIIFETFNQKSKMNHSLILK